MFDFIKDHFSDKELFGTPNAFLTCCLWVDYEKVIFTMILLVDIYATSVYLIHNILACYWFVVYCHIL